MGACLLRSLVATGTEMNAPANLRNQSEVARWMREITELANGNQILESKTIRRIPGPRGVALEVIDAIAAGGASEVNQFQVARQNQDYVLAKRVKLDDAGQKVVDVLDEEYTRIAKPYLVRCRPFDKTYRVAAGLPEAIAGIRYEYAPNGAFADAAQNPWNVRKAYIVSQRHDEISSSESIWPPYNADEIIYAIKVKQSPLFKATERTITGPNPEDFRDDVYEITWLDITARTFEPDFRPVGICTGQAGNWFVRVRAGDPYQEPEL